MSQPEQPGLASLRYRLNPSVQRVCCPTVGCRPGNGQRLVAVMCSALPQPADLLADAVHVLGTALAAAALHCL